MRINRKTKFLSYMLCVAMLAGSLAPVTTVHASEQPSVSEYEMPVSEAPSEAVETPVATEEPEVTACPEATEAPAATATPEATIAPEATAAPEATETPETTIEPEATTDPEATEVPEESASPEVTETPEETVTPEEIVTPEETATPEATATPADAQDPLATEEPADLDYILGRPMTEEERAAERAAVPHTLPDLPEEIPVESYDSGISMFSILPETYDSREDGFNTSVKNQDPYGSCWTYATIASMESTLIRKGIVNTDEVDLSEWHLAYFATHTGSDKLGNTKDDYVKAEGGIRYMNNGGNIQMSAIALSNWKGSPLESDYPGNTDPNALSVAGRLLKPEDAWLKNQYYMKNCHMSPATDRENVKLLIMEYGAVYGSYYHYDGYYKEDTAAYYCNLGGSNHAITVIGWDDNYKKENFNLQPEGDGAWLCKNSWGPNFGDEGYFYISYYDASFHRDGGNVAAYEAEVLNEGQNNYYYSGGVDFANYMSLTGIAQCYEAKGNPGGSEKITGTGFLTYSANVEYSVQVYKNPKLVSGVVTDPLSGEAVWDEPETGMTGFAGYQTIEFENPVQVDAGDLFVVVITFADTTVVVVDVNYALYSGGICVYDSYNVTKEGESFGKLPVIEGFISLHDEKDGITPRMNVFTQKEKTVRLLQDSGAGQEKLGEFYSLQEALNAAAEQNNPGGNYVIELLAPTTVVGSVTVPEEIGSLKLTGSKLTVKGTKNAEITSAVKLSFENITLESADRTFDIQISGSTLTLNDMVFFINPATLTGNGGQLFVEGDVSMEFTTEFLQGEISGFDKVVINNLFVLNTYTVEGIAEGGNLKTEELLLNARLDVMGDLTAKECDLEKGARLVVGHPDSPSDANITNLRAMEDTYLTITGNFVSDGCVSFYGTNIGTAEEPVYLRAGMEAASVTLQDVTMMEAWIESVGVFNILGNVLSEGRGNVLVTRQKPQENYNLPKTYLEIGGEVTLSEPEDQIAIYLKKEEAVNPNNDAASFWSAGKNPILVAAKASAECFRLSDENLAVTDREYVLGKEGASIYAYFAANWAVEVIREKDGLKTSLGCYRTLEQATAAVNALKDKTANYTFLLNENLGTDENPVNFVLPSAAAHVTVRGGEYMDDIYLANHITLRSDTTLDNIDFISGFASKKVNFTLGAYDLTLRDVRGLSGTGFNKITHDTKKKVALRFEAGAEFNDYTFGSVNVDDLYIADDIDIEFGGKMTVTNLSLGEETYITVTTKGNSITNLVSYVPYLENGDSSYSIIELKLNADLTIANDFAKNETDRLFIDVADKAVSKITKDNWLITAPKVALSSFDFMHLGREINVCKHDGKFYNQTAFSPDVILTYGENGGYESKFIDWYQAVAEINRLNKKEMHYQLEFYSCSSDKLLRLLSAEYKKINAPSAFVMPGKNKYASFTADGNYCSVNYKGNITVYGAVTLKNFRLVPLKIENKKSYLTPGNLILKPDKNGISRLCLADISYDIEADTVNEVYGVVFKNITGTAGKSELYLENGTAINVSGNITGLKGFYIGKDSYQEEIVISPSIGGKVTVTELGIWSEDVQGTEDIGMANGLLVLGQLTVDRLVGANGLIMVRQTSSSNKNTLAQIKKTVVVPDGKPMMVGIVKPAYSSYTKLVKANVQGKNPFVESAVGRPLIKAPAASTECFRALNIVPDVSKLSISIPDGMRYYKDANSYIRAESAEVMQIRITATSKDGESSISYAKNWYEAMRSISKMGNHYAEYKVELCESKVYMTGYNAKKKKEAFGKFTMPSKVKGMVTVTSASGEAASIVYTGEMKLPDNLTLVFEDVSVDCQNSSKASVSHKVTIGKNANLFLNDMTASFGKMSKIAAGSGSLTLKDTALSVSGTTNIKNLFVIGNNNKVSGNGLITLQFVKSYEANDGTESSTIEIETTSVYTKNKRGTYKKTKLSGFSVTGAVEENAEVHLTIKKDLAKEPEGVADSYTKSDLLAADLDGLSAMNRLAVVKGNASENRIRIRLENGTYLNHPADGYLITESGGVYLLKEAPAIRVISDGSTTTDYLGYFRSFDKALAAIETSAKKDFSISSKNAKRYEVIFLQVPVGNVTGALPKSAKEIVISHDLSAVQMPLNIKGGISHGNTGGTVTFQNIDVNATGNVMASTLILTDASIRTSGNISLKNLTMEDAFIMGSKVAVSKTTAMANSHISAAADKKTSTGTLKLAKLIDTSIDNQGMNYLSAKLTDKGVSGLSISGEVLALHERNDVGQRFAVWISKNKNNTTPATLSQGTGLVQAPKADAGMLRPAYTDIDSWGVTQWQINYGLYKKGSNLCFGDLSKVKAVLVNETLKEDSAYPGEQLRGSDTGFLSLKEAFAEVNNRKNKKASYRVLVYEDTAFKSKGKYVTLTLPTYAKELTLEGISSAYAESGEAEDLVMLSYLGKISPKYPLTLQNIGLSAFRKSGKKQVSGGGALAGGKYPVSVNGAVVINGSATINNLCLSDDATLYVRDGLKTGDISYQEGAKILLDQSKPLTLTGALQPVGEGEKLTLQMRETSVKSGTKVVKTGFFMPKPDLDCLQVKDALNYVYTLYRDGRYVYIRK